MVTEEVMEEVAEEVTEEVTEVVTEEAADAVVIKAAVGLTGPVAAVAALEL